MKLADRYTLIELAMATLGRKVVRKEPMNVQEVEAVAEALREYEQLSQCNQYEKWQDIYLVRDYVVTQGGNV